MTAAALPRVLVRYAGLPWRTVDDLMLPRAAALQARLVDLELELLDAREGLSERLGGHVTLIDAKKVRGALLGIRRGLYSLKRAIGAGDLDLACAHLPAELAEEVRARSAQLNESLALAIELRKAVDEESHGTVARISSMGGHRRFLAGLMLASPVLYREWRLFLDGQATGGSKTAGLLSSVCRYLLRAATKTSPFSTFTFVGHGRWAEGQDTAWPAAGDDRLLVSRAQLSIGWLHSIEAWLHEHELALEPLRLNPAVWLHDGRVHAIKRRPSRRGLGIILNSEVVTAIAAAAVVPLLRALPPRTHSRIEWCGLIQRAAGIPADQAIKLCEAMIKAGLLQRDSRVLTSDEDPWASWLQSRGNNAEGAVAQLLACAQGAHAATAEIGLNDLERRQQGLDAVATLRRRSVEVVSPEHAGPEGSQRQFVFEDCGLGREAVLNPADFATVMRDLSRAVPLYALYDPVIPNGYDMAAEFVQRFGTDREFGSYLDFFQTFQLPRQQRQLAEEEPSPTAAFGGHRPHPNKFDSGPLAAINALRVEMVAELRAQMESGGDAVHLPPALVERVARELPWPWKDAMRTAMFCMLSRGTGGITAVVNLCGLGHGKFLSRFLWLLEQSRSGEVPCHQAICADNTAALPPNTLLADMRGFFSAYGVQAYPRLTDHEIEYPGEATDCPDAQRIRVADLSVRFNRGTQLLELVHTPTSRVVWPVHLGFLTPKLAPPLFRALMEFAPPMSFGCARPLFWRKPVDGKPQRAPRVWVGDVLLSRAMWAVPREAVPFDLDPVAFWVALEKRRREWGMPRQVFRRSQLFSHFVADQARDAAARWQASLQGQAIPEGVAATRDDGREERLSPETAYKDEARKPMYLDFQNFPVVRTFWKAQALQGDQVMFEELWPAPGTFVNRDEQPWCTELVLDGVRWPVTTP